MSADRFRLAVFALAVAVFILVVVVGAVRAFRWQYVATDGMSVKNPNTYETGITRLHRK